MNYPEPGTTLPELHQRTKPDYRGFVARFVGFVVWVASKIPGGLSQWAESFNTKYHTTLGDTIYSPPGIRTLTAGLILHERVHRWQELHLGTLQYYFKYLLRPKKGRLELEAQAYAAEVAAGYRSFEAALEALIGRTYYPEPWYTPTEEHGRAALQRCVTGWQNVFDKTTIRALV